MRGLSNTVLSGWIASVMLALPSSARQSDTGDDALRQIQALKQQMATMEARHDAEIAALRSEHGDKWLTQARALEVREFVKEMLADSETRTSLQGTGATAGWDKGFFLSSADGNFSLRFVGSMQTRYAYNYQPPENQVASGGDPIVVNEWGFEMRRVELEFLGHIIDPSWEYKVKLSFNSNNAVVQTGAGVQTTSNAAVLEDAYVRKDLGNGFGLRVGQFKSNYDFEETISGTALQFAERTLLNSYFSTKFIQAVQLEYRNDFVRVLANYNDGGGNRNVSAIGAEVNVEWATAGRVDWKLMGDWTQFREFTSWRSSDMAILLGGAYNWQRGGGSNAFNPNYVGNSDGINISYTGDANLRYDGFSLFGAVLGNTFYARPDGEASVTSLGAIVQGAYHLTDDLEVMARFEYLNVSGGTTSVAATPSAINAQRLNIYTVGANYYIDKNKVKLTADVGYVVGGILFTNGIYGQNIVGTDYRTDQTSGSTGQVVARAQLQFAF
ncbi:MAG: hypothetical protein EXS03_02140 [Phycisphaerales bacterium]|nr:hypothetical protein [Phycisphaerales bacterium]